MKQCKICGEWTDDARMPRFICKCKPLVPAAGSDFVGFETVPTELQFDCDFAVYRKGNNSSMCYVTSKERGDLIVAALDAFVQSGEAEKWLKNLNPKISGGTSAASDS